MRGAAAEPDDQEVLPAPVGRGRVGNKQQTPVDDRSGCMLFTG